MKNKEDKLFYAFCMFVRAISIIPFIAILYFLINGFTYKSGKSTARNYLIEEISVSAQCKELHIGKYGEYEGKITMMSNKLKPDQITAIGVLNLQSLEPLELSRKYTQPYTMSFNLTSKEFLNSSQFSVNAESSDVMSDIKNKSICHVLVNSKNLKSKGQL